MCATVNLNVIPNEFPLRRLFCDSVQTCLQLKIREVDFWGTFTYPSAYSKNKSFERVCVAKESLFGRFTELMREKFKPFLDTNPMFQACSFYDIKRPKGLAPPG